MHETNCTATSHSALKRDDATWFGGTYPIPRGDEAGFGCVAANCRSCHSTLYRVVDRAAFALLAGEDTSPEASL